MTIAEHNNYVIQQSRARGASAFNNDETDIDKTGGWIYVLESVPGIYKIGKTAELNHRIKQLSIQLPFRVSISYAFYTPDRHHVERFLHGLFMSSRMNGEWFHLDSIEDLAIIQEHACFSGLYEIYDGRLMLDSMHETPLPASAQLPESFYEIWQEVENV